VLQERCPLNHAGHVPIPRYAVHRTPYTVHRHLVSAQSMKSTCKRPLIHRSEVLCFLLMVCFLCIQALPLSAQEFGDTVLHTFSGSPSEGTGPEYSRLVQGSDGNLYGTTNLGGSHGNGTVFEITSGGTLSVIYSFGSSTNDGLQPHAGLAIISTNSFYGTTENGGSGSDGTIYKVTSSGSETLLHSFSSGDVAGTHPYAGLIVGSDGNFYGTTSAGADGDGAVFKMTPGNVVTALHTFVGTDDGIPCSGSRRQPLWNNLHWWNKRRRCRL